MARVTLDQEAFKALASDTRLDILKALDVRRLTVSELSRLLSLNKATVFEHLKQLASAELVKKHDEGRKWVYYGLTWKGKNVLHPENAQIFLMLSTAVLGFGGAFAALTRALELWGTVPGAPSVSADESASAPQGDASDGSATEPERMGAAEPSTGDSGNGTADQQAAPAAPAPGDPGGGGAGDDQFQIWPPASDGGGGSNLLIEPFFWSFLILLLLATILGVIAVRIGRVRRAERRILAARLDALGPDPADASAD